MVTGIGGSSKIKKRKDMEHMSGKMEIYTSGSIYRVTRMVMQNANSQMDQYFMNCTNKVYVMVLDIIDILIRENVMDSGGMAHYRLMQ